MRGVDRDLIRGGHYGQRSCEPHLKAEHMAAPTNAANVKKALANSEPSTHGTSATWKDVAGMSASWFNAAIWAEALPPRPYAPRCDSEPRSLSGERARFRQRSPP